MIERRVFYVKDEEGPQIAAEAAQRPPAASPVVTSWIPCGNRESRISLWRPWSLAALVDATSRVSDNYRVKRFSENTPMTMPERLNDTEREKADGEAVLRHAFHGEPLDPEVARRVRERGAEITEEIYREHGEIDPERRAQRGRVQ